MMGQEKKERLKKTKLKDFMLEDESEDDFFAMLEEMFPDDQHPMKKLIKGLHHPNGNKKDVDEADDREWNRLCATLHKVRQRMKKKNRREKYRDRKEQHRRNQGASGS